jgi:hypothetical protein
MDGQSTYDIFVIGHTQKKNIGKSSRGGEGGGGEIEKYLSK